MPQNLPFGITYDFRKAAEKSMHMVSIAGDDEKNVLANAFKLAMDGQFKASARAFASINSTDEKLKLVGVFHASLCLLLCGEICAAAIALETANKINADDYWTHLFSGAAQNLLGMPARANAHWEAAYRIKPNDTITAILNRHHNNQDHPERHALIPICRGSGLDIGCGSNKTHPNAIGVDVTPIGRQGFAGGQNAKISLADITASGDNLHMFEDQSFDYIVQRHNLEHYQDPIRALQEWHRLLKPWGLLGMVIPDDRYCDTIKLDPTHKHVFTQTSLERILSLMGGFEIVHMAALSYRWSFLCVARKIGAGPAMNFDYLSAVAKLEKKQIMDKAAFYDQNGLDTLGEQCRRYAEITYHSGRTNKTIEES